MPEVVRTRREDPAAIAGWEHFDHDADVGVRGTGRSLAEAFEQAALGLTAVVTTPESIRLTKSIDIECPGTDPELLLVDFLNAVVYEMATRKMLFAEFEVTQTGDGLRAAIRGEPVDVTRHHPAVEVKGATFTALRVARDRSGRWIAQTVLDV